MKVMLTGYFGAGNFGDDLMLESFLEKTKQKCSNLKFDILKLNSYQNLNIKIPNDVEIIDLSNYQNHIEKGIRYSKVMKEYDWIIWVGGTCFTEQDGDGLYKYMIYTKKILKKKIGYIGVGIGDIKSKNRIKRMKHLLLNSDILTFRDKNSYEKSKKITNNKNDKNIYLTEDIAYLYIDNDKAIKNTDKYIVFSWRNLSSYLNNEEAEFKLMKEAEKLIVYMAEKYNVNKIKILPLDDIEDIEKNKKIYHNIKYKDNLNVEFLPNKTTNEKHEILQTCYINISGRLHGIFITELMNTKTIPLSYARKINEFLKSIGKKDSIVDVYNLNSNILKDFFENEINNIDENIIKSKKEKSLQNVDILINKLKEQ